MSVEYEPKLLVGWRVRRENIPDFDERYSEYSEEWSDLGELVQEASELLGKQIWTDSLCDEEDAWCGDTQMVGVPMFDLKLPIDEFEERMKALGELAVRVYRQVMQEEPEDGPWLISWTKVS